ncbi:hypothetical protein F5Y17DRAFT_460433 [Xylariaceae sp. FL0594]|nr:hypothetical protein F5Y17DRAFT_460433 [Xylariaceae sp. FL0594]
MEDHDYEIIIIGAGIAGINAAYRVHTCLPGYRYAVLEARHSAGGTWDLFRYPGVRSDASMHAFGFAWFPWGRYDYHLGDGEKKKEEHVRKMKTQDGKEVKRERVQGQHFGTGEQIRKYIADAAAEYGIDRHIKFGHHVVAAEWNTEGKSGTRWCLSVDVDDSYGKMAMGKGEVKEKKKKKKNVSFTARWILLATEYYDYESPRDAKIPGLDSFRGQVINPQFWPSDLVPKIAGQKIAIIGSGATATSILPELAGQLPATTQITLIQRSPSYIAPMPGRDTLHIPSFLPSFFVDFYRRAYHVLSLWIVVLICTYNPDRVKRNIRRAGRRLLRGTKVDYDEHFTPSYNPWDQRICLDVDGKFYKAFRRENVDIMTGEIEGVTEGAILVKSSRKDNNTTKNDKNNG